SMDAMRDGHRWCAWRPSSRDGHSVRGGRRRRRDGPPAPGMVARWGVSAAVDLKIADHAGHDVAFHELLLAPGGLAQRRRRDPIDLAEAGAGGLMQHGERVGGEYLAVTARATQPQAHVLGGVVRRHGSDREAPLDTGVERAVPSQLEAILEVREADEDE